MSVNRVTVSTTTQTQTTKTEEPKKKKTWLGKFGSWFNRNSQKIGASMSILGDTAMGVSNNLMQYQLTKDMLRSGSIWGMGGYMYGGGMFGSGMYGSGMFGGSWMMNGDPLGLTWSNGGYDGYDSYYTQMGNQAAYNYGYQMGFAMKPNTTALNTTSGTRTGTGNDATAPLEPENNEFAEFKNVSEQDREAGKDFDETTDSFIDPETGKIVSGAKYNLNIKADEDGKFSSDYREKLSELGKSYLAHIENETGEVDDDGIAIEEFKKHEMSKLSDDVSETERKQAEINAENAFHKMDINNDGQIDWKEYSAAIMTFDQDAGTEPKGKTNDGVITSKDYAAWSELMGSEKTNLFDVSIRKNYKHLFNESEDK